MNRRGSPRPGTDRCRPDLELDPGEIDVIQRGRRGLADQLEVPSAVVETTTRRPVSEAAERASEDVKALGDEFLLGPWPLILSLRLVRLDDVAEPDPARPITDRRVDAAVPPLARQFDEKLNVAVERGICAFAQPVQRRPSRPASATYVFAWRPIKVLPNVEPSSVIAAASTSAGVAFASAANTSRSARWAIALLPRRSISSGRDTGWSRVASE